MTLLPFDAALVRKRVKMLGRRGEPEKEALGLVKLSSFSQRCTLLSSYGGKKIGQDARISRDKSLN